MPYGVRLHAWGARACFTRPELKVERVSYEVMTPSAARGILEAIHWKPAIRWVIDQIEVLRPIRFQSFRRNEVGVKYSALNAARVMQGANSRELGLVADQNRQQRAASLLVDVDYVIHAHFEMTTTASTDDTPAKHLAMFNRRAAMGQYFHHPYLGTREFPASFALIADGAPSPASTLPADQRWRDLGWMLHDIDHRAGGLARFMRARLEDGVLDVHRALAEGEAA